jgi:multiple sugar transport system ATP-binding protein
MTVYENMAFALNLRKTPKAEIDEAVRLCRGYFRHNRLLNRKPKALSGGQRQRRGYRARHCTASEGVFDG